MRRRTFLAAGVWVPATAAWRPPWLHPDELRADLALIDSALPEAGGDRNLAGIPMMTAFRMLDWRGGSGAHVDFSPVCPATECPRDRARL